MLVLIFYIWDTNDVIFFLWLCCCNIFDKILSWTGIAKKHHTIPAEILPNDSETLFPKGECLSTHRVGPLGLNGFLHLGLLFEICHPCAGSGAFI